MTTIVRITCKHCGNECELTGCTCRYPKIEDTSRDAVCKRIKAALVKRSGKQWSVTGGRGTAYGWITISAPKARLGCARLHDYAWQTNICTTCGKHRNEAFLEENPGLRRKWLIACPDHACTDRCYGGYIVPEDREELATLLGLDDIHMQGVSIPASTAYYIEHIDRAEGRTPRKYGVQYWD